MPPRDPTLRIADILREAKKVVRYVEGMNLESFSNDERTVDAVLRCLSVIGEAASQLPDAYVSDYPAVPWRDIRGMRNIVIHQYFGVSLEVVWRTATVEVPDLIKALSNRA